MKFNAKVIEKGLVGWKGQKLFLSQDVINNAVGSLKDIPVCIEHDERKTVGRVTNASLDGNWIKCEGTTNVDGYKYVSVAYRATIKNEKGEHNNLQYDKKAEGLECYHLALTNNPRYSDAQITDIQNSMGVDKSEFIVHNSVEIQIQKEENGMKFLNVFNNKKDKVDGLSMESVIVINEKEISISELAADSEKAKELTVEVENMKVEIEELKAQDAVIVMNDKEFREADIAALQTFEIGDNKYTREEAIKILNEADTADKELKAQVENSKSLTAEDSAKALKVEAILAKYNKQKGKK